MCLVCADLALGLHTGVVTLSCRPRASNGKRKVPSLGCPAQESTWRPEDRIPSLHQGLQGAQLHKWGWGP